MEGQRAAVQGWPSWERRAVIVLAPLLLETGRDSVSSARWPPFCVCVCCVWSHHNELINYMFASCLTLNSHRLTWAISEVIIHSKFDFKREYQPSVPAFAHINIASDLGTLYRYRVRSRWLIKHLRSGAKDGIRLHAGLPKGSKCSCTSPREFVPLARPYNPLWDDITSTCQDGTVGREKQSNATFHSWPGARIVQEDFSISTPYLPLASSPGSFPLSARGRKEKEPGDEANLPPCTYM